MWFVWAAVFVAALFYASKAIPKTEENTMEAGKPDAPTSSEGIDVPIIFGTVQIKSYNLAWWGDVSVEPVKEKGGKK
jgi:hypothetical protein